MSKEQSRFSGVSSLRDPLPLRVSAHREPEGRLRIDGIVQPELHHGNMHFRESTRWHYAIFMMTYIYGIS